LEAPVLIVLTTPEAYNWLEDLSIAGEVIYLEATNQGLGTCWMQIRDIGTPDKPDPEGYVRKVLGIPEDIRVLCFFPIGYPKIALPEHTENEFELSKIHPEKW